MKPKYHQATSSSNVLIAFWGVVRLELPNLEGPVIASLIPFALIAILVAFLWVRNPARQGKLQLWMMAEYAKRIRRRPSSPISRISEAEYLLLAERAYRKTFYAKCLVFILALVPISAVVGASIVGALGALISMPPLSDFLGLATVFGLLPGMLITGLLIRSFRERFSEFFIGTVEEIAKQEGLDERSGSL